MSNPALDAYKASTTEEQMTASITDLVEALGGVWMRIRDSRGQAVVGYPDLTLVVPMGIDAAVVSMIELKRMAGRLSPMQQRWHGLLTRPNIRFVAGICRPLPTDDAYSLDEILEILRGGMV